MTLFNGLVVAMTATHQLWKMPSGLRVGLTRGEVIAILGHVPGGARPDGTVFNALACSEGPRDFVNWSAEIAFGPDKRVQSISFVSLSP